MIKKRTILLVERDFGFALLVLSVFQRGPSHYRLRWVTGAHHAQDYLQGKGIYSDRKAYPRPDLLILDLKTLHMNGGGGLDCSRKFPGTGDLPIAVLGASGAEEEKQRAASLGASSYHVKSKDADQVRKILHDMLQKLLLDGSRV